MSKLNYTVLGISSGLGVSLFPFKKHLIGNIEGRGIFHTPKDDQWKINFGDIPLYKGKGIPPLLGKADVLIASPDCGSGSIFRLSRAKVMGDHTKNDSLLLFFLAVDIFKPKFFLFENLDGLFKSFPEQEFKILLEKYRLVQYSEPVSAWGNSQIHRKRLVIVGIRKNLGKGLKKYFKLPKHVELKNCHELYGDLVEQEFDIGHAREDIMDVISIHARRRMSLYDIRKEWRGRLSGKKRWEVEGGKFSTAPGVYRNMDNDYPATARKANRQFNEDGLTLTPRQLARIQGVPDDFKLYMNPDKPGYSINKARTVVTKTPPYEISVWFKKCLEKALKQIL